MSAIVELVTGNPDFLRGVDAFVTERCPERRGFAFVDLEAPQRLAACVHVRPFIRDRNATAGYRVDVSAGEIVVGPGYVTIFVAGKRPLHEVAYESILGVDAGRLWFKVELPDGPGQPPMLVTEQGRLVTLPRPRHPAVREVPFVLRSPGSERPVAVQTTLPFCVRVSVPGPSGILGIEVGEPATFGVQSCWVQLASPDGREIGPGRLHIDARVVPDGPDEIVVAAEGFAAGTSVELFAGAAPLRRSPVAGNVPLKLHVLYDRTTLDAVSWSAAYLALFGGARGGGDEGFFTTTGGPPVGARDWNIQTRTALAAALASRLSEVAPAATVHLLAFADVARTSTAAPDLPDLPDLPVAEQTTESVGEIALDELAGAFGDASLGYARGFDLFDAADEALDEAEQLIAADPYRARHAVLIVGDSPPPPSGPGDVLWRQLVNPERGPRTNARRSKTFDEALERLRARQVPVGWLFVRLGRLPAGQGTRYEREFEAFAALQNRVRAALAAKGLSLETANGHEMERPLGKLLQRMLADGDAGVLHILGVP